MGRMRIGKVLVDCAATTEGEHLHAEAYPKDRDIWVVVEFADEFGLECLAGFDDGGRFLMGRMPEGFGCGVVAAGEDEGVELPDEINRIARHRWENHRDATGLVYSLGIGHGEVGGRTVFADHQIGSDGDERAFGLGLGHHSSLYVGQTLVLTCEVTIG